jgi:NADH-quinone oxidoreductase subunit E
VSVEKIDRIVDKYADQKGVLIQLLLDIQKEFNWIPKEAVVRINQRLKIPVSEIYRVASFYTSLSLKPRGRHLIRICLGAACYVRGGPRILDSVERCLSIKPSETTADGRFSLETVSCLGACDLGPVIELDGKYHGRLTPTNLGEILSQYK